MWGLFILPIAVPSILSAVVGLTGGMKWVMAAAVNAQFHRRKGYKPNEGHFTPRCQDTYFGIWFDSKSSYDLNRDLGKLAEALPGIFPIGKKFDMTMSEGEFLRTMMVPALGGLADFRAAKELVTEMSGSEDSFQLLYAELENLANAAIPIARWLEEFPRTKDVS